MLGLLLCCMRVVAVLGLLLAVSCRKKAPGLRPAVAAAPEPCAVAGDCGVAGRCPAVCARAVGFCAAAAEMQEPSSFSISNRSSNTC